MVMRLSGYVRPVSGTLSWFARRIAGKLSITITSQEHRQGTLKPLDPQGVREGQHAGQRAEAAESPNAILEWDGQDEGLPGKDA
jgi:hypothetical protein